MLLINAIYFKGEWVKKFSGLRTLQRSFTLSSGRRIKVDMMANTGNYLYYSGEGAQVARLPYGRNKIAMYVILPDEGIDLDSYVEELEQEKFDGIIARMSETELELQMPRLKLEYGKKQLNKVLTRMGMGIAFNGAFADFRGIASVDPERLFVSSVDHKAVVEVNEKGTEAAAVTSIGIRATSMIMTARRFVVNRPYLFLIRDDRSGLILFMGKILDPTKAKPQ
jgi:serine protease inhibitor